MGAFPHHVQGDAPATVYTVLGASLLMVLAGGLGGLPFFFVPKGLSKRAAGLANALSCRRHALSVLYDGVRSS